jgi:hypothetical protein
MQVEDHGCFFDSVIYKGINKAITLMQLDVFFRDRHLFYVISFHTQLFYLFF